MAATQRPVKFFTVESANRTLPLVSRIVEDVVRLNARMWDLYRKGKELVEKGQGAAAEEIQDELQGLAYERSQYIEEMEEIGCLLKDPDVGLVDFPARRGDRVVYLCWKLGEPRIAHWHEIHAGFAGRQPVEGEEFLAKL
ncbi:MAG: DUF2203 domain-containing protein [Planctomycetes bacterium]|nr:DUF2203 domain-containing protein [Planctomycetota bacterium]